MWLAWGLGRAWLWLVPGRLAWGLWYALLWPVHRLRRALLWRARRRSAPRTDGVPATGLDLACQLSDQLADWMAYRYALARREQRKWNSFNNLARANSREGASIHARELADALHAARPDDLGQARACLARLAGDVSGFGDLDYEVSTESWSTHTSVSFHSQSSEKFWQGLDERKARAHRAYDPYREKIDQISGLLDELSPAGPSEDSH